MASQHQLQMCCSARIGDTSSLLLLLIPIQQLPAPSSVPPLLVLLMLLPMTLPLVSLRRSGIPALVVTTLVWRRRKSPTGDVACSETRRDLSPAQALGQSCAGCSIGQREKRCALLCARDPEGEQRQGQQDKIGQCEQHHAILHIRGPLGEGERVEVVGEE